MVHNYFEDYGYDSCTSRGVCSISPKMASVQEIVLLYLREFAYYSIKLKKFNIEESSVKNLILNVLSAFVSNPEIKDNMLDEMVSIFSKELNKIKLSYINSCKSSDLEPELIQNEFDLTNDCDALNSIRLGEKQYSKHSNLDKRNRIIHELIFFSAKSITTYILELNSFGEDSKSAYDILLELLDTLNNEDIKDDDLKSILYNVAEEEYSLIKRLAKIKENLYGEKGEVSVSYSTYPNKAILVEGTNIKELVDILNSVKNMGIDVYTHGEMLVAHTYPKIQAREELRGHFGKGCGNTLLDFSTFPGAIFVGKHSIDNIDSLYRGRIFTSDLVVPSGVVKIENSDYEPLIASALEARGFKKGRKVDNETVGFNLDFIKDKINSLNSDDFNAICFVTQGNDTYEDKSYFEKLFKLLPEDIFIVNFTHHFERKNIINIPHCYDLYSVFEILAMLKEKFDTSDVPIIAFVPKCDKHITNLILNMMKFGVKKVFMGKCAAKNLNPVVAKEFCDIFDVIPYSLAKDDYKQFIDLLSL